MAGCSVMSNTAHFGRHNQIWKIIHRQLAHYFKLSEIPLPYYKYKPIPVIESGNYLFYWNKPIVTDNAVNFKTLNIIASDKLSECTKIKWLRPWVVLLIPASYRTSISLRHIPTPDLGILMKIFQQNWLRSCDKAIIIVVSLFAKFSKGFFSQW